MPLSEQDFREPAWIRYQERYPMSYDKKDRFITTMNPRLNAMRHGGTENGWKQAGYNPNHQSTRVERISINTDEIQLKPY